MSKTNTFENQIQELLFNNVAIAKMGDASGLQPSAAAGNLYVRLMKETTVVDDANAGDEADYTGYVAGGIAVPRTGAGWTVSSEQVTNAAAIVFGGCTAGSNTIRYIEIWKDNVSANLDDRIYHGQLTADLAVSAGITPEFAAASITIIEN